ncbi:MAG: efflux RND transporter periplasmic adaptor subunit [Deltaproteobacteria bacterium]|nr:efflux RND transporter periplasmic adaptor subunit [Deltaproteobacteria bacterium]
MKKFISVLVLLLVGAVIGSLITLGGYQKLIDLAGVSQKGDTTGGEKKPLYWVAPMDPAYKRDKPGKSPMGMDLIPVYEDGGSGSDTGPGTIKISPDVVNNLGVRTALAERRPLHSRIQTVGYVQYDEDRLVHIHPRVKGWIERLYVKASGDPVKRGQPLYAMYSPQLVNAQEELVIALDRKTPRLIRAAENRLAALRVPPHVIKKLRKSKEVKQTITFYAPQSGVVDNLNIRQGFFVKPDSTIMSIGTLDQVWVEAEVFERQASLVAVGLAVTMTLDYLPGKEWRGSVNYIYPALNAKTRTLRVRLRFDNKDHFLKPNMFAQVVIHAKSTDTAILVPKEAVIRTGSTNRVVLALGEGRFKSINVKIGRFDSSSAEILSGLNEDDRIVTSAQFLIDSESSKTSDFKRMYHDESSVPESARVEAVINSLMVDHRMINITHQPVSAWDWPEMSMDFKVVGTVDLDRLQSGMNVNVEITKTGDKQFQITDIRLPSDKASDDNMDIDDLNMDGMKIDD